MSSTIGETATITLHGKSRPCIVLDIMPNSGSAIVAVGSTVDKDYEHITITQNSLEARQMCLRQTTHFYITKIFVVDLKHLTQIPRKSHCPRHVFAQLRAMASRRSNAADTRYTGDYRGHIGSYESTGPTPIYKKSLTTSLGDLLKKKLDR